MLNNGVNMTIFCAFVLDKSSDIQIIAYFKHFYGMRKGVDDAEGSEILGRTALFPDFMQGERGYARK